MPLGEADSGPPQSGHGSAVAQAMRGRDGGSHTGTAATAARTGSTSGAARGRGTLRKVPHPPLAFGQRLPFGTVPSLRSATCQVSPQE